MVARTGMVTPPPPLPPFPAINSFKFHFVKELPLFEPSYHTVLQYLIQFPAIRYTSTLSIEPCAIFHSHLPPTPYNELGTFSS